MGVFAKALAKSTGHNCWNCKQPGIHYLTNKPSHLGGEWGLICHNCGKDLTDWYLLRGFVQVKHVIAAEQKARIRNARISRNITRSRQGNKV